MSLFAKYASLFKIPCCISVSITLAMSRTRGSAEPYGSMKHRQGFCKKSRKREIIFRDLKKQYNGCVTRPRKNFKYPLKYCGNFYPSVGNTGINCVRQQPPFFTCFFSYLT